MALTKGARRLYEWLVERKAGESFSYQEVMDVAGWSESSLTTYLKKNKIAPFLQPIAEKRLKVLLNGSDISEKFFDETFTQTAPRRLSLSANDRLEGEHDVYELLEPLGNGAIGHVWLAKAESSGELVAAKVMLPKSDLLQESKLPNIRERFRREARNGRTFSHPNIVVYLDTGHRENNPFLVMELARKSIAKQLLEGAIPEEEAAEIVQCAVFGLQELHSKGCRHRDVKPANLLEFEDTIKLGDLGIVRWSDFDPTFTHGGTITRQSVQLGSWFYMAPEQQQSPHDAVDASDVYALGVTWIELLSGNLPAPQAIGAGAYRIPDVRDETRDLISRMVAYEPTSRPALGEILSVIKSAYA